jgi:hypothetical protein
MKEKEEEYEYEYKKVISTNQYAIYKNNNINQVFKIKLNSSSKELLTSIKQTKLLNGIIINSFFTEISFHAFSISTLSQFIKKRNWSYDNTLELIKSLTVQLNCLNKQKSCFYGYNLDTIIVINENIYLQVSNEYIVSIQNQYIDINNPFNKNKNSFISPELLLVTSLPNLTIHYKTIYYSLASLCIYLLFKEYCIEKEEKEVIDILNPIQGTKLYWFLLRGIEKNILLRSLLYI